MNVSPRFWPITFFYLCVLPFLAATASSQDAAPPPDVSVRIDALTVTPAHLPVIVCRVTNQGEGPLQAAARIELPDGWSCRQAEQSMAAAPGETVEAAFSVTKGVNREENRYPIALMLDDGHDSRTFRFEVPCATAPYFKPEIDGRLDDWNDALGLAFPADHPTAEVRTYWNRRGLAILVAVKEDQLTDDPAAPDAVQVAVSSRGGGRIDPDAATADRHELLLIARDGQPMCLRLAEPDMERSQTGQIREPASLEPVEGAELKRWREGKNTYYECAIPLKSLAGIRAAEGRTFGFSVLVHDGDRRELRDLGLAVGLEPAPAGQAGWSRFAGDQLGECPPCPSNGAWGMCSSKY